MSQPPAQPSPDDVCQTCSQTRKWHQDQPEGAVRHEFNDGSIPVSATFGRKDRRQRPGEERTVQGRVEVQPWPLDPVLRQALINKGVITPDDLRHAEAQIRAVTGQVTGVHDGEEEKG